LFGRHRHQNPEPPDTTTGELLDRLGVVVVVVVGEVVVLEPEFDEPDSEPFEVVEVDTGTVVVELEPEWKPGVAAAAVDLPGISLATTAPMTTVAPVATAVIQRLRCRTRLAPTARRRSENLRSDARWAAGRGGRGSVIPLSKWEALAAAAGPDVSQLGIAHGRETPWWTRWADFADGSPSS
jgi:hypothetical protein